jgi:hypothetical protein
MATATQRLGSIEKRKKRDSRGASLGRHAHRPVPVVKGIVTMPSTPPVVNHYYFPNTILPAAPTSVVINV